MCLFVKDPQRLVKDYLAENGNGGVTRVLGIEKLRKEYKTHEGRRELLNQYDHFLVDARVAPMMPNLLGNAFLKAKKMPLAVRMDKDVVRAIERCLGSTSFTPRQGTSCSIRVARGDWAENEVVENVLAVVDGVIQKLRRGWSDVQSVNLKTNKSPALPIYVSLPGINGNKTTEVKSTAEQAEKIKMNTEAAEGVNELLKSTSDKNEEGEDDDGEGENEEEEGENEEEESDDEEEEGVRMGDLVEMWADDDDEDESESEEEQGDISDDGDEKKVEKLRKDEVGSDEDAVVGEDNTKKGTGARSSKAKAQESDRHHVPLRRSSRKAVLKKAETATYDEDINSSDSGNDSSEGDGQKAKEATEATPRRSARKVKPTATPKKDGDEGMQTPRRSQRKPNAKTVKTIEKASTGGSGSGRKLRSARKASSTRR